MSEDFDNNKSEILESIIMTDDDGNDVEFYVINAAEMNGARYLLVVMAEDYDKDEPEAYIIKEVGEDDDEMAFEFVEDDTEYNEAVVMMSDEDNDYEIQA